MRGILRSLKSAKLCKLLGFRQTGEACSRSNISVRLNLRSVLRLCVA